MKKIYGVVACLLFAIGVHAQVGIGTQNPNTHAVLELKSPGNNQGLILPSLTTVQRTSATFTSQLGALENGLLVYDKDENKFYFWQNNAWQIIVSGTIAGGATGPASGDLTGNYPAPQIAAGAVGANELANNAITDVKITSVAPSKLTAGGATTGQVLKWNGTNWTAQSDNTGTGTVTSVATGTGLMGGPITTTGTISLADNGVTTIKINDGAVTDVKITSVAPAKLTAAGATTGQVLKWNGTNWTAQADNTGGAGTVTNVATGIGLTGGPITASGTISLADNGVTTVKINDAAVTTNKLADASVTDIKISTVAPSKLTAGGAAVGQVLKYNGTNWTPQADNGGGAGTVPNVVTGDGLTGGPVTTSGTISIVDGGVTSVKIADGAIVNADINASAAIVDTKLATIATAGKVLGGAITSGTITGTTGMNISGNIITTGRILASNATTGGVISAINSTAGGYAVAGSSTSTNTGGGIYGTGTGVTVGRTTTYSYGVYGNNSFSGAFGWIGGDEGVHGENTTGTGVTGSGYYGVNGAGSFIGVLGSAPAVAGNYGVFSSGQAGGTTTWAATSDQRFKKNIQPLSNALDNILKLRGVSYDWRTDEFPNKNFRTTHDIGVIAQEILPVLPEAVVQDREGYYSVSYEKIVPVLIEAIKELEQQISALKKENDKVEALQARLDAIEKLVLPSKTGLTANSKP